VQRAAAVDSVVECCARACRAGLAQALKWPQGWLSAVSPGRTPGRSVAA